MAEEVIEILNVKDTSQGEVTQQAWKIVYSNHTQKIPGLIEETLKY